MSTEQYMQIDSCFMLSSLIHYYTCSKKSIRINDNKCYTNVVVLDKIMSVRYNSTDTYSGWLVQKYFTLETVKSMLPTTFSPLVTKWMHYDC